MKSTPIVSLPMPGPRSMRSRRLQADRAHRDARRTFFVEGVRNVVQAIENGFHIETLVYSEKLLIVPIARRLVRDRCRSGTPTLHVSPETFRADLHDTPRLRRGRHRRPAVVAAARRLAAGGALLGRARGGPLRGEPRQPDPDLGGRRRRRVHPGRAPDRPLRPRGRPRLDGGAVPADVHPDERPQPPELAPPPSLPRHRRLARRVGRAPSLRLSPPDDPRPRRGAPGPHARSCATSARTSSASRWSARPTP